MPQETDMTGFIIQAGMLLMIQRAVFAGIRNIPVQDHGAVQDNFYMRTVYDSFFGVPLSHRFQVAALGGYHAIHGAVILIYMKILVNIRLVVQYL